MPHNILATTMRLLQYGFLLASIAIQLVHSKVHNGTYIALCPSFLRPGLPFTVSLNILKPGRNYMAQMEIRNSKNRRLATMIKKHIKFGQPTILRIDEVPAAKLANHNEQYHVYIKGKSAEGSVLFENEQNVILIPKSVSFFVQTDKAVYIPDSIVKFRAIVVKPDLKPYQDTVTVKIMDPKDNIVKQWLNSKLNTGVYSKSLKLANDPPLGDWKIFVQSKNGEQLNQTFSVEKYVLPRFDVTLDLPTVVTIKDDIIVTVNAKYTYGKKVAGSVRLMACNTWHQHCTESDKADGFMAVKTKNLDNTGKAIFRFTKRDLSTYHYLIHQLETYSQGQIMFTASVTEDLTGIERTETETVNVHKTDLYIKIKAFKDAFKPGLPNNFLIAVKRNDGSPVYKPLRRNVKLVIKYWNGQKTKTEDRFIHLGNDGMKTVQVVPPAGVKGLRLEAYYDPAEDGHYSFDNLNYNLYDNVELIPPRKSPTNTYLELMHSQEEVKVGQKVKFDIKTTEAPLKFGTFQVLSRGNLIMSKEFSIIRNRGFIELTATPEMAPKSRIVVFAMREDNKEIVVDSIDFKVTGIFKNDVKLSINKDKAKNNEKVKIRINAKPNSFVGISAIDQRALLLRDRNDDFTTEKVENENEHFGSTKCDLAVCGKSLAWLQKTKNSRSKRSTGRTPIDAYNSFEKAGLFVMTDAYLYREDPNYTSIVEYEEDLMHYDGVLRSQYSYTGKKSNVARLVQSNSKPIVRKKFPETWIWMDSKSGANGELVYEATVPDSITSWAINAFAIEQEAGLGIAPHSALLEAFRPFFIQLNLPYSIKRGENFGLQVLAFNYQKSKQSVTLTLKHHQNSGFEFVKKSGQILKRGKRNKEKYYNVRSVEVPGNGGSNSVFFPIVATKIGEIKVHVTAVGNTASDAVKKSLLVEPEGFRVEKSIPVFVKVFGGSSTFKTSVETYKLIPSIAVVAGSEKSSVSASGEIMTPSLRNLRSLIEEKPDGCGEQSCSGVATSIVTMRYLRATNHQTDEIEIKAKENLNSGYQRVLKYQLPDNSYSGFPDEKGSIWLTAFVVRTFKQAEPYLAIDEENIKKSIEFLNKQQAKNGEFKEKGEFISWDLPRNGVALTAYVLAAFLENDNNNPKALLYVEENLHNVRNDSRSLAIAAYVLHLAGSSKKDEAFNLLKRKAMEKDGMMHWSGGAKIAHYDYNYDEEFYDDYSEEEYDDGDYEYYEDDDEDKGVRPIDVETTGYALLTYLMRNKISEAAPIARWLIEERNAKGGYYSSQDTVVGLQALGAYAEKAYKKDKLGRVEVNIKNGSKKKKLIIEPKNADALQSVQIENLQSPIRFKARGKGTAYAQVQYSYHTTKTHKGLTFDCNKDVTQKKGGAEITLGICCKYKKKGTSNMALMEIEALSGYTFDDDEINKLTKKRKIQRVELEKDDTKANLYFSYLNHKPICVNITSRRSYPVAEQKEATVILYDYYEPSDRIEDTYSSKHGQPLSKTCPHCWDKIKKPQKGKCKDTADRCKRLSAKRCKQNTRLAQWMHKKCRKLCKRC